MSLYRLLMISAVITLIIDYFLLMHIPRKDPVGNSILGLHITLVGLPLFYLVYNQTFYTQTGHYLPYFVVTFIIVTGLAYSLFDFVPKSKIYQHKYAKPPEAKRNVRSTNIRKFTPKK